MTTSNLEFIYDSENGSVRAVVKEATFLDEKGYIIDIGFFLVGTDEFMVYDEVDFLTAEDMKLIIKKMEEYNAQ